MELNELECEQGHVKKKLSHGKSDKKDELTGIGSTEERVLEEHTHEWYWFMRSR